MTETMIAVERVAEENQNLLETTRAEYSALGENLARRNADIDAIKAQISAFCIAIPSWGVGAGSGPVT